MRGYTTHPTADSTLADFRRSKRSLYASPTACVAYATPPTAGSTLADFRRRVCALRHARVVLGGAIHTQGLSE